MPIFVAVQHINSIAATHPKQALAMASILLLCMLGLLAFVAYTLYQDAK